MTASYQHIISKEPLTCQITLTAEEQDAVLSAYDNGIEQLTEEKQHQIDVILSKLKDQIHR